MNNRINAIYARISVDREDSISTETQIEKGKYLLQGESYEEYVDRGYSGKNVDRPQFQKLMDDVREGLVAKVVVYKLDRISRSILDFATMMQVFDEYHVEFVSSTEQFDTSTAMGRAVLSICIVFAQLERETIGKRVQDAYVSRSKRGFYMGGKLQYGYNLEPTTIDGIPSKKLVQNEDQAKIIKLLYEMYAQPQTTVSDLIRYLNDNNIILYKSSETDTSHNRKNSISSLTKMLRNPVYAKADVAAYNYFKNSGALIFNDISEFTGDFGCYWYSGKGGEKNKTVDIKGHEIVIAPHEGIVPGELWVKCVSKLKSNKAYHDNKKAKNTWLAGKMKCGYCGHALRCICDSNKNKKYWISCGRRAMSKDCVGIHAIPATELETYIFEKMKEKMKDLKPTNFYKDMVNPKLTAMNLELSKVEKNLNDLFEKMAGANAILMDMANKQAEELDKQRQRLKHSIAEIESNYGNCDQLELLPAFLDKWEAVSFEDKRAVLDTLMIQFTVTDDLEKQFNIKWKFE